MRGGSVVTAVRWWVKLFARWKARISGVQADISLFYQGVTASSLGSAVMEYLGAPWWAIGLFLTCMVGVVFVYAWAYAEGGVWNQTQRDKRDMSNNFAGPNGRIVKEIGARGIIAGLQGEPCSDEQRAAIREEMDAAFVEYRDGIDLGDG